MKRLRQNAKVRIGEPGEYVHIPGTVTIHVVLHPSDATSTGAAPLSDIAQTVAEASRTTAAATKPRFAMTSAKGSLR
jgi:hypothetical protein